MNTNKKGKLIKNVTFAVLIMGGLSACSPRVDTRGNSLHVDDVAKVLPGEHTRAQVMDILGSPSARATFDDEAWYYIAERTETVAFFEPELVERQIFIVKFDDTGRVSTVDVVDENSAENVDPTDRVTPTAGNKLGVIEQMLSNVGRFNKNK